MDSVAYAIETVYNEYNDFAEVAVRKLVASSNGLLIGSGGGDGSVFVAVHLTGEPMPQFNTGNPVTKFGFVMPNEHDVAALRQQPANIQTQLLCAQDYFELADHVVTALNWAYRHIRSRSCHVISGLVGDSNPDPRGAEIVGNVSSKWANDELEVTADFDERLFEFLDGENPPPC